MAKKTVLKVKKVKKAEKIEEVIMKYITIKTEAIIPSGNNPRTVNTKSHEFAEFRKSIKASGVRIPPMVRIHPKKKDCYELLAGERRLTAAKLEGLETIGCVLHENITDEQAFEITFFENFQRLELTPIEQGKAAVTMLKKYSGDIYAAASRLGKSISWLAQRAAIDKLSDKVKALLAEEYEDWTASHIQQITGLPEHVQLDVLDMFEYNTPSVAELGSFVVGMLRLLSKAPWDVTAAGSIVDDKGKKVVVKCCQCLKRSSAQPGLFDDSIDIAELKKNDRCTDGDCWQMRMNIWLLEVAAKLRNQSPDLVYASDGHLMAQARRELDQQFGQVTHQAKLLKRGGKGAVPAIIINGPNAGQLRFIKPESTSKTAKARPKDADGQPIKKPLKERQAELEKKRWFAVLQALRGVIGECTVEDIDLFKEGASADTIMKVVTLACYVGTDDEAVAKLCGRKHWDGVDMVKFKDFGYSNTPEALENLFNRIKPNIQNVVDYNGPITQTPDDKIAQAKVIAKLLTIDIDAIYERVVKKITEPKSWAAEK